LPPRTRVKITVMAAARKLRRQQKGIPCQSRQFFEPQRRGLISLDLNEKAHRRKRRWAFKNRVGAAGFEPDDPTAPRNERSFYDKSTVVKECVLVRHCEATSHRAVAFGLEESARWPYGVPNLADIKERMWVAHLLGFLLLRGSLQRDTRRISIVSLPAAC
jgi:hypothetical protein